MNEYYRYKVSRYANAFCNEGYIWTCSLGWGGRLAIRMRHCANGNAIFIQASIDANWVVVSKNGKVIYDGTIDALH